MLGRYIAKEIFTQFATVFVVVNTVVFISQLLRLSEMLFRLGLSLENILLPVLFEVVSTAPITIPTTLLFATMLALERLNRSGELTALLAAGYSLSRVLCVVMAVAGLFYVLTLVAALYLDPWGRQELVSFSQRKAYEKVANIRQQLRAGVFLRDIPGYVLHVQRVGARKRALQKASGAERYHNVMLAPREESRNDFVITAHTAQLEGTVATGDLQLVFEQGVIYTDDTVLQFKRWYLDLVHIVHQHLLGRKVGFDARRLYPRALRQHLHAHGEKPSVHTQLLWQRRLGRPLLVLAFAVLGMLLGIRHLRRGRNLALLYTVLTVFACFSLGSACEFIAHRGLLSPALAIWLPHVLLVVGALLLARGKNNRPLAEPLVLSKPNTP